MEGKAAYDVLFSEVADYIKEQTYNGNSNKGLEMPDMLNQAGKYVSWYNQLQDKSFLGKSLKGKTVAEKVLVKERLVEKKFKNSPKSDIEKAQSGTRIIVAERILIAERCSLLYNV